MPDSKPYEIRTHLLQLAKDILSENSHLAREFYEQTRTKPDLPMQYTVEQVIAEAEKLYAFVNKK